MSKVVKKNVIMDMMQCVVRWYVSHMKHRKEQGCQ